MVRGLAGLLVACSVSCTEPGGRAAEQTETADARDTTELGVEIFVPADLVEVDEVMVDATAETAPETIAETTPETVAPEVVTSVCASGCLPLTTSGAPTNVLFRQYTSQPRPILHGGAAPAGQWVLSEMSFYSQGTFANGIVVAFGNHGATAGRMAFDGDALALALDLDLDVTVTAFGSTGSDSSRSAASLGGCHSVAGSRIMGSFGSCGAGIATESAIDFELTPESLVVGVEMPREALIDLLPADQRDSGAFAIVGPMYLVTSFRRP